MTKAPLSATETAYPKKKREIQNDMMDSTRWNELDWRAGDVVIATWSKAGTTWLQQIVAQLIFDGRDVEVNELSPWLEFTMFDKGEVLGGLKAQTNRRFIKTHLPVDALGLRQDVKYIYIARDGRDCAISMHTFLAGFGNGPGSPQINPDILAFFRDWLEQDDVMTPFFPNVRGWWNARHLPNVLLMHYNNLKADMAGEIRRVADFLDIVPSAAAWPKIIEHCSFDYMKSKAENIGPRGARMLKGGSSAFFHKGTIDRWKQVLTPEDVTRYESAVARELTSECAHWLRTGELPME
ncbi:MAG: sulfotransferase domain-containing protein [Alphaproteobacteria bacterium]